jgi:tetratricopeptide (TPR) repeat protein
MRFAGLRVHACVRNGIPTGRSGAMALFFGGASPIAPVGRDLGHSDHLREGEIKEAIEVFKLNLLAYPDSADAHNNLADGYLRDGQKDLARQLAEKGLALLDSHAAPASSWSDTEERRGEVRSGLQDVLKKLDAAH